MYICFVCNSEFAEINILITHLKYIHGILPSSKLICPDKGCPQTFFSFDSYKKHLKIHKGTGSQNTLLISQNTESSYISSNNIENRSLDTLQNEHCPSNKFDMSEFRQLFKNSALMLLCKLHSKTNLSRKCVMEITKCIDDFLINLIETSITKISDTIPLNDLQKTMKLFSASIRNPFENYQTEYRLIKHLEENDLIVSPNHFLINDQIDVVRKNNQTLLDQKKCKGILMPLKFQLKQFLELPNVYDMIMKHMTKLMSEKKISNFVNGELWKTKIKNFKNKTVIPYFLFIDDLEVNNPLGSHRGFQKITAIYYSIPVIPPEYISMLENIFLAGLFKAKDCKLHGKDKCFYPLVNEIKELSSSGLTLCINGENKHVYFVLGLIIGDNLGLNDSLGFTNSFNANFFCRFCRRHKSYLSKDLIEYSDFLRDEINYNSDLKLNDLKRTGIVEDSLLNTIDEFHVTKNYAVDIMHDIFEGICHYNLSKIISHFINELHLFTLETLNARIQLFSFGETENGNIPSSINISDLNNHHFNMSAREMWCFFHHLPFIIGDLIPRQNTVWQFFLTMLKLFDLIVLPEFDENTIAVINHQISEMNSLYMRLFNEKLKPKHHFLVHYGTVIKQSGPLKNLSCFRFEAKHHVLKTYANNTTSRINICYSIAIKLQYADAFRKLQSKGFEQRIIFSDFQKVMLNSNDFYKNITETDICFQQHNFIFTTNEIKVNGTVYKKDFFITLCTNEMKVFQIDSIIISSNKSNIYFMLFEFENENFDEHFEAYIIKKKVEAPIVLNANKFLCPPVHSHKILENKIAIRLKYF